ARRRRALGRGRPAGGAGGVSELPDPHERVRAAASARGLDIEIVSRPEAGSLHEAAALLGLRPSDIVKTLVVKRPSSAGPTIGAGDDSEYLFALVPGGRAISWPKLRAVVGAN